jgi:hypothetical protein
METVRGKCKDGSRRDVSCWTRGGRLWLWLHKPDSDENKGYEVSVAPDELFAALARALMGKPARDLGRPGDGDAKPKTVGTPRKQ